MPRRVFSSLSKERAQEREREKERRRQCPEKYKNPPTKAIQRRRMRESRYSRIIIHELLRRHHPAIKSVTTSDRLTHKLGTDLTIMPYKELERLTAWKRYM